MNEIIFYFRPVSGNNYSRMGNKIQYIVVHDTGNTNKGAGAMNHKNYVATNTRGASAHYFVDDKCIVQFIGDSRSAGAVGDGKGRYGITNRNSLSVEMCINSDADYNITYFNTLELVKNLMVRFNIPWDRVVRHYDASRKSCPNHMKANNWAKWWKFKEDLKQPMKCKIDLSKDSINKCGTISVNSVDNESKSKDKFISAIANVIRGQRLNILPSVTIAQAILESNWGESALAVSAKNLFGIKASKDWQGEVYNKPTKEQDSNGVETTIRADFRRYKDIIDSIKDHDNFFVSTSWRINNYQRVLVAKDYKEQAKALQLCGYATDKQYANKLINLIEKYNLNKYDKENVKMENKPSNWAENEWEKGKELGITDGTRPKDIATREEVVAMLVRTIEKLNK